MVRIRPGAEEDLLALGRVFSVSAGYLTERYRPDHVGHLPLEPEGRLPMYRHLLATGAIFVAEDRGEPVGFSAAIVRDHVWFLSQLWVTPERHGGGLGSALLDEALAWGRGSHAFSVVASPHPAAQTLYLRASMYPAWSQLDVTGGGTEIPPAPPGTRPMRDEDRGWIDGLDREVRGAARPQDHDVFVEWGATALVVERDGRPLGYMYAWSEGKLGPAAARDPNDLPALIAAGRNAVNGPVTAVVPSVNWTALRELVRVGMAPFGANTFMTSVPLGDASRYLSSGGGLG